MRYTSTSPTYRNEPTSWSGGEGTVYVMCRTGHRASIATSILDTRGVPAVLVDGGFPDWVERGYPVDHPAAD